MDSMQWVRIKSLAAAVLISLMFCFVHSAAAAQEADKWQNELTLYAWLPSIDGDLKYTLPGDGGGVSIDASDILDSLNMTFMGNFVTQYNKWSFGMDVIYLDLSNDKNTTTSVGRVPVDVHADLSLEGWLLSGIIGYDVVQNDRVRLAAFGGVRYFTLDTDAYLSLSGPGPLDPQTSLANSTDLLDAIVGVRGSIMLSEHWFLPYYADIGAGDAELTYQLYSGIGYMFSWGDIRLGYRYLKYEQDDKFLEDFEFYGFMLGVGFRF